MMTVKRIICSEVERGAVTGFMGLGCLEACLFVSRMETILQSFIMSNNIVIMHNEESYECWFGIT